MGCAVPTSPWFEVEFQIVGFYTGCLSIALNIDHANNAGILLQLYGAWFRFLLSFCTFDLRLTSVSTLACKTQSVQAPTF